MGMILPLIIFVMFLGLNAGAAYRSRALTPPTTVSSAIATGQNFIRYRDAVTNYATANPGFAGIVPIQNLLPYLSGGQPAAFANMNNAISSASGGGRQITSYLIGAAGGAAASALAQSKNDASIGQTDAGGNWSSYSNPISTSTQTPAQNSNLVSVLMTQ